MNELKKLNPCIEVVVRILRILWHLFMVPPQMKIWVGPNESKDLAEEYKFLHKSFNV